MDRLVGRIFLSVGIFPFLAGPRDVLGMGEPPQVFDLWGLNFIGGGFMAPNVATGVSPELLRQEFLPCCWCGDEIDYAAEPGSWRSFIVDGDRAAHYGCAAVHSSRLGRE